MSKRSLKNSRRVYEISWWSVMGRICGTDKFLARNDRVKEWKEDESGNKDDELSCVKRGEVRESFWTLVCTGVEVFCGPEWPICAIVKLLSYLLSLCQHLLSEGIGKDL